LLENRTLDLLALPDDIIISVTALIKSIKANDEIKKG
jgi:hypothetical protein